jgi:hypothetical protein
MVQQQEIESSLGEWPVFSRPVGPVEVAEGAGPSCLCGLLSEGIPARDEEQHDDPGAQEAHGHDGREVGGRKKRYSVNEALPKGDPQELSTKSGAISGGLRGEPLRNAT